MDAGLSLRPLPLLRQAKVRLYHPVDGHLLEEGELMVPRFNIHRCLECTSVPTCVGCTDCGSCKQVELVSMER